MNGQHRLPRVRPCLWTALAEATPTGHACRGHPFRLRAGGLVRTAASAASAQGRAKQADPVGCRRVVAGNGLESVDRALYSACAGPAGAIMA